MPLSWIQENKTLLFNPAKKNKMEKAIRLEIEIEKDFATGLTGKFDVHGAAYTKYTTLLNLDELTDNVKTALSKLSGFTTLTLNLIEHEAAHSPNYGKLLGSYRYIGQRNDKADIKRSVIASDNMYKIWHPAERKEIFADIKNLVQQGNRRFIELVQEQSKPVLSATEDFFKNGNLTLLSNAD